MDEFKYYMALVLSLIAWVMIVMFLLPVLIYFGILIMVGFAAFFGALLGM